MSVVVNTPLARIRTEAACLMEAAERDHIEPDGSLGNWVRAQQSILYGLADALEFLDARVAAVIANTRELSVMEVQKLHKANALAQQVIEAVQTKSIVLDQQSQLAVSDFMAKVTPQIVEAMSVVASVKERHWNRRRNLMGVSVVGSVLVGVFGAGFVWGGGNLQGHAPGEAAKAAVARCLASAQPDRTTGERWCRVAALVELKS